MTLKQNLLELLHENGNFLLGRFLLKSGQESPIYIDLRNIISVPSLLQLTLDCMLQALKNCQPTFDCVCGVPYGALPLATGLCLKESIPMLMRRKEAKDYGTKKLLEGKIVSGQRCLIVEDVATHGTSTRETVELLRRNGLVVTDALVLLDRQQGATETLATIGVTLHSVLTMDNVLEYLRYVGKISAQESSVIKDRLSNTNYGGHKSTEKECNICFVSTSCKLKDRIACMKNEKCRQLLKNMVHKESNLCVAADFTKCDEILQLARQVGPEICMLKVHSDIIEDFNLEFIRSLQAIALEHRFLLFEDRKLADTGTTVALQLSGGILKIADWADFVTVHALPGPAVLAGLRQVSDECSLACFVVAEMSSENTLTGLPEYKSGAVKLAESSKDLVAGFICQKRCGDDPSFLYLTPGVHMDEKGDALGQQFRTAHEAVCVDGNDIIIVGRGITKSADVSKSAATYRLAAWSALKEATKL